MSDNNATIQFGYVCPEMFVNSWDSNQCTIEPEVGGASFIVLDHSLQTVIFRGKTTEECQGFLGISGSSLSSWSLDFFEESGHMITCPHCLESYWSEDGHPEGTMCPKFGIDAPKKPIQEEPGMVECRIHSGTLYWYEDGCKKCEAENPE